MRLPNLPENLLEFARLRRLHEHGACLQSQFIDLWMQTLGVIRSTRRSPAGGYGSEDLVQVPRGTGLQKYVAGLLPELLQVPGGLLQLFSRLPTLPGRIQGSVQASIRRGLLQRFVCFHTQLIKAHLLGLGRILRFLDCILVCFGFLVDLSQDVVQLPVLGSLDEQCTGILAKLVHVLMVFLMSHILEDLIQLAGRDSLSEELARLRAKRLQSWPF
mmetsp:Transcript_9650/g.21500  ORF Transcript_9650/g.21500 Transcript_9650/m.21500 type:complete len:216 (-) Transcript_9650:824-1471(-)